MKVKILIIIPSLRQHQEKEIKEVTRDTTNAQGEERILSLFI